jgi:hypothetical protein
MKPANRFVKGQSVYTCTCCGRKTRQVGTGDCENVEMCFDCYELTGIENGYNDGNLEIQKYAADILQHYGSILSKGGDVQSFEWIRSEAIDAIAAKVAV